MAKGWGILWGRSPRLPGCTKTELLRPSDAREHWKNGKPGPASTEKKKTSCWALRWWPLPSVAQWVVLPSCPGAHPCVCPGGPATAHAPALGGAEGLRRPLPGSQQPACHGTWLRGLCVGSTRAAGSRPVGPEPVPRCGGGADSAAVEALQLWCVCTQNLALNWSIVLQCCICE